MKSDIQSLMRDLSQQLNLPTLRLDESHCCGLEFDRSVHTELRYVERADVFNLVMEVGDLPTDETGSALRWLAAANLDPVNLDGCHFAFDSQTRKVCLCRTLDAQGLDCAQLLDAIGSIVRVGKCWRGPAGRELQMQAA